MVSFFRRLMGLLKPVDRAVLLYALLTAALNLVFYYKLGGGYGHLLVRGIIILGAGLLIWLDAEKPNNLIQFARDFYPLVTLIYFYGETYYYNQLFFHYFDSVIFQTDQWLFGYQPSLEFSRVFHWKWLSELMNFAYFSYYLMIFGLCLAIYLFNRDHFDKAVHVVMQSFFIYYVIFILFPVMGPQFWFPAPLNQAVDSGFFRDMVKMAQYVGENPTGAFPSSHVGMSLILCILSYKYVIKIFPMMLAVAVLLSLSAVYIKAHYATDILGGIITGPLAYWLSMRIYQARLDSMQSANANIQKQADQSPEIDYRKY